MRIFLIVSLLASTCWAQEDKDMPEHQRAIREKVERSRRESAEKRKQVKEHIRLLRASKENPPEDIEEVEEE